MSNIAEVKATVGEDGIRIAVDALKEIAADEEGQFRSEQRVEAARTLLSYSTYYDPEPK